MKSYEFTEQSSYNYYRIDAACADTVRKLLAQLLETFLDCPDSCALLTFNDEQLYDVARAYRYLCRVSSPTRFVNVFSLQAKRPDITETLRAFP